MMRALLLALLLLAPSALAQGDAAPAEDACAAPDVLVLSADGANVTLSVEAKVRNGTNEYDLKLDEVLLRTLTDEVATDAITLGADKACERLGPDARPTVVAWAPARAYVGDADCAHPPLAAGAVARYCLDVAGNRTPLVAEGFPHDAARTVPTQLVLSAAGGNATKFLNGTLRVAPPTVGSFWPGQEAPLTTRASLAPENVTALLEAIRAHAEALDALEDLAASEDPLALVATERDARAALLANASLALVLSPSLHENLTLDVAEAGESAILAAVNGALSLHLSADAGCAPAPLVPDGEATLCIGLGRRAVPVGAPLAPANLSAGAPFDVRALDAGLDALPEGSVAALAPMRLAMGGAPVEAAQAATLADVQAFFADVRALDAALAQLALAKEGDAEGVLAAFDAARAALAKAEASGAAALAVEPATALASREAELESATTERLAPQLSRQRLILVAVLLLAALVGAGGAYATVSRMADAERTRAAFRQRKGASRARMTALGLLGAGVVGAGLALLLADPMVVFPFLVKGSP